MRAFRTEAALEDLVSALKVLSEGNQEGLLERIATRKKQGRARVKNVSKFEFQNMSRWMKKLWSTRANGGRR